MATIVGDMGEPLDHDWDEDEDVDKDRAYTLKEAMQRAAYEDSLDDIQEVCEGRIPRLRREWLLRRLYR